MMTVEETQEFGTQLILATAQHDTDRVIDLLQAMPQTRAQYALTLRIVPALAAVVMREQLGERANTTFATPRFGPGADESDYFAGRIFVTAFNDDQDTLTALVETVLSRSAETPENERLLAEVLVGLLAVLRWGLDALVQQRDGGEQS